MFGAAAMSLSSFCVVTNALRLNLCKVYDPSHDRAKPVINKTQSIKEETKMTKTLKIEGMMCAHCEATVKKALEAITGVESAEVSYVSGTAVVTADGVSDGALKDVVVAKGYEVLSIE